MRPRDKRAPTPPPGISFDARPLTLRIYPDPVLRTRSQLVRRTGRDLEAFAHDMLTLMYEHGGIGLAAPQVGLAMRLIVADIGNGPVVLVDPDLAPAGAPQTMEEGCLSLPNIRVEVSRPCAIEVRGLTPGNERRHFEARGLLARVQQHEVDHLDGILIIDRGQARLPPSPQPKPKDDRRRGWSGFLS